MAHKQICVARGLRLFHWSRTFAADLMSCRSPLGLSDFVLLFCEPNTDVAWPTQLLAKNKVLPSSRVCNGTRHATDVQTLETILTSEILGHYLR